MIISTTSLFTLLVLTTSSSTGPLFQLWAFKKQNNPPPSQVTFAHTCMSVGPSTTLEHRKHPSGHISIKNDWPSCNNY